MNKEILEITKKFHDTYEKLASEYTYETREDTKVFDINSSNGKLMYATVNEIVSPILKEKQKLKQKYENAVADYETTMFEKEQLNNLVNSCQEEIRQLKKQLENKYEKVGTLTTELLYEENTKLINRQQEFIKFLEDEFNKIQKEIEKWEKGE